MIFFPIRIGHELSICRTFFALNILKEVFKIIAQKVSFHWLALLFVLQFQCRTFKNVQLNKFSYLLQLFDVHKESNGTGFYDSIFPFR